MLKNEFPGSNYQPSKFKKRDTICGQEGLLNTMGINDTDKANDCNPNLNLVYNIINAYNKQKEVASPKVTMSQNLTGKFRKSPPGLNHTSNIY
jgi:hypothetical protein